MLCRFNFLFFVVDTNYFPSTITPNTLHRVFVLLPSGKRFRCLRSRTSRLKNSFFPRTVSLLNSTPHTQHHMYIVHGTYTLIYIYHPSSHPFVDTIAHLYLQIYICTSVICTSVYCTVLALYICKYCRYIHIYIYLLHFYNCVFICG